MTVPATFGKYRRLRWATLLALGCAYGAQTGLCYAQEEKIGARAAAAEGAKAFQEGRWADAIDYFTRAESLVHAPPHLLYIARSQKQTGLLVQARENLLSIIREDLPGTAPHAFHQAQDDAKAELKDLEPRLPFVTVSLKGAGSSSVTILQDGNKIPSALVGVPRPVDPGTHTFEATAGSLKGRVSVDVKEGEKKRVVLELGAGELPPAPPPTTAPTPPPSAATPAATSPMPSPTEPSPATPAPEPDTGGGGKSTGLLIGSIAGFAVGVGGVAIGAISMGSASSHQSDSDTLFNDNNCAANSGTGMGVKCTDDVKAQISDLDSQADSARTLGVVGFVAGGVGVAAGTTLLIMWLGSGKSASSTAHSVPAVHVSVTPSFIRVGGTF
jgi:hypothetical protein